MNAAVIGIGSNINPNENIESAVSKIAEKFIIVAKSRFVETEPIGYLNQPNFINGVVLIHTELSQNDLKQALLAIESRLGRIRTNNTYGPRTIDLDIVVWNGEIVDNDVYDREFLKIAVAEVLPEFEFSN